MLGHCANTALDCVHPGVDTATSAQQKQKLGLWKKIKGRLSTESLSKNMGLESPQKAHQERLTQSHEFPLGSGKQHYRGEACKLQSYHSGPRTSHGVGKVNAFRFSCMRLHTLQPIKDAHTYPSPLY